VLSRNMSNGDAIYPPTATSAPIASAD